MDKYKEIKNLLETSPQYESIIVSRLSTVGIHVEQLYSTDMIKKILTKIYQKFLLNITEEEHRRYHLDQELWHAFSNRLVPCLDGELAKAEFSNLKMENVWGLHHLSISPEVGKIVHGYRLYNFKHFEHVDPSILEDGGDFYFVSSDYSWMFICTHEDSFGPYYVQKA